MSLEALATSLGYRPRSAVSHHKTGLFFVLNRKFLPGLKVLIYSLIVNETFLDLPIYIVSEERELIDDPFIQAIADHTLLATSEHIKQFSGISSDKVVEDLRLDWIAKYTYMKWLIFDNFGLDQQIFIDSDIICLKPANEMLDMTQADMMAGPVFEPTLTETASGRRYSSKTLYGNMRAFARTAIPPGERMNSGVMVINKNLLNSQTRADLIAFAEQGKFPVEQRALREWLSSRDDRSMQMFSPKYNFNAGYFLKMSAMGQIRLLGEITFLHFSGRGRNPWERGEPKNIADDLWWHLATEAGKLDPLFQF